MSLLAALFACGPSTPAPEGSPSAVAWGAERPTAGGAYRVSVAALPDPPPQGELFAMEATVRLPDGSPVEDAVVHLDAGMPHHGHGMQTKPELDPGLCVGDVCSRPGGVYVARGFKFHMGGAWTVTADVDRGGQTDRATFVVEVGPR